MDFSFTEEQLMLQDVARRIAQEKIAPSAEHHDRTGEFPLDNIRLLGENGLMGIEVPTEYGGAGMDPVAYVLAMVEVAAADAAHSTIMSVNNSLFCNGILTHGTEAQKQTYVRAIAEGEAIGAFALTEPQSGSDATAMRCRAVKQADGSFVINGKKSWITSGPVAKYIVLFAMSEPDKGARGITAFIIDTDKAGFGRGKTEPKLGIRASATCEIEFNDYVAAAEDVLGQEGEGFKIAMKGLDGGRINIGTCSVGAAQGALDAARRYMDERRQFNRRLAEFQALQFKLADMATHLVAARQMVRLAACKLDAGAPDAATYCAMAKRFATDMGFQICLDAQQIHGGYGYLRDYPLERLVRDTRVHQILEGTNEIMRVIIARQLLEKGADIR